jgi:hypothetical protein
MKAAYWVVISLIFVFILILALMAGMAISYYYMIPYTQPEVQYKVEVVTVEVPKIVMQEVIVTKEIVVTATPSPVVEQLPPPVIPSTPVPTLQTVEESCIDVPYIEMQPKDYVQGDALKMHTLYNVHVTLYNGGTCTWDGYKLYSGDSVPIIDVPVPYTPPGSKVTFSIASGEVRWPLQYMIVMMDSDGNFVPFANGTKDGCMAWTMETLGKTPGFQQTLRYGFSSKITCGSGG